MPFLILILGGLLIMMGQHDRSEALFYYFRLEDQLPESHLLRQIDRYIRFAFVREKLKESYSDTGRPSIDPELLPRILLIGYLYGISSERKLVEELRMYLAWRWFTGLGFDQEIASLSSSVSTSRPETSISKFRFVPELLFHDLRRTGARNLRRAGVAEGIIMKIGGWRTRSGFERYAIVSRSDMNDAILKLQDSESRVEQVRRKLEEEQEQNKSQIGHNEATMTAPPGSNSVN
jgi:transposase